LPSQPSASPLKKYVLGRYVEYLRNYEGVMEKKFPSAMRIFRIFKVGIKDFYVDTVDFLKVAKKVNLEAKAMKKLSKKELALYFKMPSDMVRVAPVLLISALPFANYIMFPLAYLFPRQLLSSHFWSLQQRTQFAVVEQKQRLKHYKPVFRALQAKASQIKMHPLYPRWRHIIALLGSGLHPTPEQIYACKNLFENGPFDLQHLLSGHLVSLLHMHNLHMGWRRRSRLIDHASMIQLFDKAIVTEGGVTTMNHDEVRTACFLRGLNPTNMNADETGIWLTRWVSLSLRVGSDNPSLILHLPIFLAYNHPSNWVLLHS